MLSYNTCQDPGVSMSLRGRGSYRSKRAHGKRLQAEEDQGTSGTARGFKRRRIREHRAAPLAAAGSGSLRGARRALGSRARRVGCPAALPHVHRQENCMGPGHRYDGRNTRHEGKEPWLQVPLTFRSKPSPGLERGTEADAFLAQKLRSGYCPHGPYGPHGPWVAASV